VRCGRGGPGPDGGGAVRAFDVGSVACQVRRNRDVSACGGAGTATWPRGTGRKIALSGAGGAALSAVLDGTGLDTTSVVATARKLEELIAWQLAGDLRDRIYEWTAGAPWREHQQFRDQLRDAASSAPRNLAEGFGHFNPREFARYARIARASLVETRSHLYHARAATLLDEEQTSLLLRANIRALAATTALLKYLVSCAPHPPRT
jgi:four helix bundle protein